MIEFIKQTIKEKAIMTEIVNEVDLAKQKEYMDNALSSLGLSKDFYTYLSKAYEDPRPQLPLSGKISLWWKHLFKNKEEKTEEIKLFATLKEIETFFYAMTDLYNSFIFAKKDEHMEQGKEIIIVPNGHMDEEGKEYLTLAVVNKHHTENIIPLEATSLHSDKTIRVLDFTNEYSWDNKQYLLFEKFYDKDKEDSFFDEIIFNEFKKYIPYWEEQMREVGKYQK